MYNTYIMALNQKIAPPPKKKKKKKQKERKNKKSNLWLSNLYILIPIIKM